jgi:hypothetical protein
MKWITNAEGREESGESAGRAISLEEGTMTNLT